MEKRIRRPAGLTALFWRYLITTGIVVILLAVLWWFGMTGISKKSAPCLAMQWRGALFPFFPLYSFITSLMKPSMRWALSCLIRSVKWAYLSRVKAAVAWPRLLWMVFISSPARIALTA